MTKVMRTTKKKFEKRLHGLGWRMSAGTTKVHTLNYEDT